MENMKPSSWLYESELQRRALAGWITAVDLTAPADEKLEALHGILSELETMFQDAEDYECDITVSKQVSDSMAGFRRVLNVLGAELFTDQEHPLQ